MFYNPSTQEILSIRQLREAYPQSVIGDDTPYFGPYYRLTIEEKPSLAWNEKATLEDPVLVGDNWKRSWTVANMSQSEADAVLNTVKLHLAEEVSREAENYLLRIGSPGYYKAEEYRTKFNEAKAFKADPTLTAEDLPMLFAHVGGPDGSTPDAVADLYILNGSAWPLVHAAVAATSRTCKGAIEVAATPDAAQTARDAIDWSDVETPLGSMGV